MPRKAELGIESPTFGMIGNYIILVESSTTPHFQLSSDLLQNIVTFHTLYRIKLLSKGQFGLSAEVRVLSVLRVTRGKPFRLALLLCQSGTGLHAVGRVGIHGEQGLAFACCSETYYPIQCPPPSPVHPAPPHPPGPSVRACFSSSLSEVRLMEQWTFYSHKTWNVSECSSLGPSLLSENALCPLCSRETERRTVRS